MTEQEAIAAMRAILDEFEDEEQQIEILDAVMASDGDHWCRWCRSLVELDDGEDHADCLADGEEHDQYLAARAQDLADLQKMRRFVELGLGVAPAPVPPAAPEPYCVVYESEGEDDPTIWGKPPGPVH